MAESTTRRAQRQGPLDHLGLAARAAAAEEAGIRLCVMPHKSIVELRGAWSADFARAVERLAGVAPPAASPETATNNGTTVFWMGPDRWWLIGEESALPSPNEIRQTLAAFAASAVEIGDSFACIRLSGPHSRDVLAKGCTIDLHPRVFAPGAVVQTNLAKGQIALHQSGDSEFQIFIRRSFAEYLWTWLEDAGLEYGVAVDAA